MEVAGARWWRVPRRRASVTDPDVDLFTCDEILFARCCEPNGLGRAWVAAILLVLVPSAMVILVQQAWELEQGFAAIGGWWNDYATWLGVRSPSYPTELTTDEAYVLSADFPMSRDYAAQIVAVMTFLAIPCIFAILRLGSGQHSALIESHCLTFPPSPDGDAPSRAKWSWELAHLRNSLHHYRASQPLTLAVSVLVSLVVYVSAYWGSMFEVFAPDSVSRDRESLDDWVALAQSTWWARPGTLGSVVWLFVGALGVHIVLVQTVAGLSYVSFLRRTRECSVLRPSDYNFDGHNGWLVLRRVIWLCFASLVMSALTGFALMTMLRSSIGAALSLLALVLLVIGVSYVVFGMIFSVRRSVLQFKNDETRRLADMLPTITSEMSPEDAQLYALIRAQVDRVEQFRSIPFGRPALALTLLSVSLPVVLAIVTLLEKIT